MFLVLLFTLISLVSADENKWVRMGGNCVRPYGFAKPILCFPEEEMLGVGDLLSLQPRKPPPVNYEWPSSRTITTTTKAPITLTSSLTTTTTAAIELATKGWFSFYNRYLNCTLSY